MKKKHHIWFGAVFVLAFLLILGWLGLNWISLSATSSGAWSGFGPATGSAR